MSISPENTDTILKFLVSRLSAQERAQLDEQMEGRLDAIAGDPNLAQDRARFVRGMSDSARVAFNKLPPARQRIAMDTDPGRKQTQDRASGAAERFPGAARITQAN